MSWFPLVGALALTTFAAPVHAGGDPPGCTGSGIAAVLIPYVDDAPTNGPVVAGQEVDYQIMLAQPLPTGCSYVGGQLSITFPGGQFVEIAGYPGTPDIGIVSFDVPLFIDVPIPYVVDPADAVDGILVAQADYGPTINRPEQLPGTVLSEPPTPANAASVAIPLPLATPDIHLTKDADTDFVCDGVPTTVSYTYTLTTGDGDTALENVTLDDDLCGPVVFDGGDDGNALLEPGETWTYTCSAVISEATTNVATATGQDVVGGGTHTAVATATVGTTSQPVCAITGPSTICPGGQGAVFSVQETSGIDDVTFAWSLTGDGVLCSSADGDSVCVDAVGTCNGSFTLTATVTTGECTSQCQMVVTVGDDQPPSITVPSATTADCSGDTSPNSTGSAIGTDACDPDPTVSYTDAIVPGGCAQSYSIVRTWTVTDACGNSVSAPQTIEVTDTTAPVLTVPQNVTVECDQPADPDATGHATATDDCDDAPVVTYTDAVTGGCTSTILRSWTATDACGNISQDVQVIIVTDTTPPAITLPGNVSVACDESTDPSNTGEATALDFCDGEPTLTWSDTVTEGACPQERMILRTWTATDACGNSQSRTQFIDVEDTEPPLLTVPPDVTLPCDADPGPGQGGQAEAQDACDADPTLTFTDEMTPGDCDQSYQITRTWTATDACGNATSAEQVISIADDGAPALTIPADIELPCDADKAPGGPAGEASASDDCDADPEVTFTDIETGGNCAGDLTIQRIWTATDACGNTSSATQTITVVDTEPPALTLPADLTVECDEPTTPDVTGQATALDECDDEPVITYSDSFTAGCLGTLVRTWTATDACGNSTSAVQTITLEDSTAPELTLPADAFIDCDEPTDPSNTGFAIATDSCDPAPTITYEDQDEPAGSCEHLTTYYRTWTATDACGNTVSAVQTIHVDDTTLPVIDVPGDVTVQCGGSTDPADTGEATATDNCDDPTLFYIDSVAGGACAIETIITRTWTASDGCGNVATADQIITVTDSEAPVLTLPADFTGECGGPTTPDVTGEATATDTCDDTPEISYFDVVGEGACPQEQTIFRIWSATDACGNAATQTQTITMTDTTAPQISLPADTTVECNGANDPSVAGEATAEDGCDEAPAITYSDSVEGDGCGGTITRTWTATDGCGNSSSGTQMITLVDSTAPVVTPPPTITVACDEPTTPDHTGFPSADDDCDETDLVVNYTDVVTGGHGNHTGPDPAGPCTGVVIQRTWIVRDACGNEATAKQTIRVEDDLPPQLTLPAPAFVGCDDPISPEHTGEPFVEDSCDQTPDVSYRDTVGPGSCTLDTIITRTWTATDSCGNSVSAEQTITVSDDTAPVLTVPPSVTIACTDPSTPEHTGMATATDTCDDKPLITHSDSWTAGCVATLTRTWTASDECGNSASVNQTITVIDDSPPELIVPVDVSIGCDQPATPDVTGQATAEDACDPDVEITYSDEQAGGPDCVGTIIRTWTATDACGNALSGVQNITLDDTTPPDLTVPADAFVACTGPITPDETGEATATDACDDEPVVTYVDAQSGEGCQLTIVRTWTATDACGNAISADQTISVLDDTAPDLTVPADITIECTDDSGPGTTGQATADDTCDETPVLTFTDALEPGACVGEQVLTRTWTATDACGNVASADQVITLVDTTPPTLTAPEDVSIECDGSGETPETGEAAAKDDCDPAPVITFTDEGSTGCTGTIVRTWTATDACGNVASAQQLISLQDTTAPVITAPADTTAECGDDIDPNETGFATATDACDDDSEVTWSDVEIEPGSCDGGAVVRTWTATDACGNTSQAVQVIALQDTSGPIVDLPDEAIVDCDSEGAPDPGETGEATAIDTCHPEGIVITYSDETISSDLCAEVIVRTWVATDVCGNSTVGEQTITISDISAPDLGVPPNAVIECGSEADVEVTGVPVVADNCSGTPQVTYSDEIGPRPSTQQPPAEAGCLAAHVIYRTWTAEDDCGNTSEGVQLIWVVDTTAPNMIPPGDMTTLCGETHPDDTGWPTQLTDDCDPIPFVLYEDEVVGGPCPLGHQIIRRWMAVDHCENETIQMPQFITVIPPPDPSPPDAGDDDGADRDRDDDGVDKDTDDDSDKDDDAPPATFRGESGSWLDAEGWTDGETPDRRTDVQLDSVVWIEHGRGRARNVLLTDAASLTVAEDAWFKAIHVVIDPQGLLVTSHPTSTIDVSSLTINGEATFLGGTVNVATEVTLGDDTTAMLLVSGIDTVLAAAEVAIGINGHVAGNGLIRAPVYNDGVVEPGPGILTVEGDYTQGAAGIFAAELTDPLASETTALEVLGTARLAGTLVVNLPDDLTLDRGDRFTVVTADAVEGSFDSAMLPEVAEGLELAVGYEEGRVVVEVRGVTR